MEPNIAARLMQLFNCTIEAVPHGTIGRGTAGPLDGYAVHTWIMAIFQGAGWRLEERWSDSVRWIWVNDSERIILTYCEGDMSVLACSSQESYQSALDDAADYYAEY